MLNQKLHCLDEPAGRFPRYGRATGRAGQSKVRRNEPPHTNSPTRRMLRQQAAGARASVSIVWRFRRDLLAHWRLLLGALACSLGFALARLAEPWPLKFVFDNVLTGMPLDTPVDLVDSALNGRPMAILAVATVTLVVLAVLRGVLFARESILTTRVGQEVVLRLRKRMFRRLQQLSLDFHARSSTGDMLTRMTSDVASLRELLVGALLALLSEGLVLAGFLTVMFLMEWRLALVAVVAAPLVFGLMTFYSGRIRAATHKQRRFEGQLAGRVQEVLSGIHLVQLFAREEDENDRLRRLNKRSLRTGLEATRLEAELNRAVEVAVALALAATLWVGALQVIAGRLTPGELIVFIAYTGSFYRPLRRIAKVTRRASKAAVSVERIAAVLDAEPTVRGGNRVAPRFRGELCFEAVEFAYRPGTNVIERIDALIAPGWTVALVGATGAGKSTLLGLVPRLHDATAGTVRIDGIDVRELTLDSLRDQIAVVPQDGMLFHATVRENIAYGRPEATDWEIEDAAHAALVHDVITALPEGYDTIIGERGVTLSGGQRQRLAIARALVKNAPIVLLDEPTTGLDAESEALVLTALERLLKGRTALVIAHRLATVRRADFVLVLEGGCIVERGTHAELLACGGAYARLHALQLAA